MTLPIITPHKNVTSISGYTPNIGGVLQRKCACGGTPGPTGECAACKQKREAQEGTIQRSATNSSLVNEAPEIVHNVLRSPGEPLERNTRTFMESRFGEDFSRVRIHTDSRAAESARAVNARAYTVGSNVAFARGQYQPNSLSGQTLLAHELTHVVQQQGQVTPPQDNLIVGNSSEPSEREAEQIAVAASNNRASVRNQTGFQLARIPDETMPVKAEPSVASTTPTPQPEIGSPGTTSEARELTAAQDIPPPGPDYPHFTQLFFGEVVTKILESEFTCEDRRERSFWIWWNLTTKTAFPGDTVLGEPSPKACDEAANVDLGGPPRDRKDIIVAGFFHNHPPLRPGCVVNQVGPSIVDKNFAARHKRPGLVMDFTSPGQNTNCKSKSRGIFFFGPSRRES